MTDGALELRAVQELIERLTDAVLPGAPVRFIPHDEPRYRSALRLQLNGIDMPGAVGGVLAGWAGQPAGTTAAHVRLFLEPWASVRSGRAVECAALPDEQGLGAPRQPAQYKKGRIS
jgi:hypothetical protein